METKRRASMANALCYSWIGLLAGAAILAFTQAAGAEEADADKANRPVVVVFMVAGDTVAKQREQQFVTDLELLLEGLEVERVETGVEDFLSLPLQEQLERIKPFAVMYKAVAITWIEDSGPDLTLLHLVALSTGRALVRIVETERGPNAASELALAARELLGEAYLFDPSPKSPAVSKVVARVKEDVVSAPTSVEDPRWGVMPYFSVGAGVYGHEGPSLHLGVGLALELRIIGGFFSRIFFAGSIGPRERVDDGVVTGLGWEAGLAAGYNWRLGQFSLGPVLGVAATRTAVDMALDQGDSDTYSWWNFHGSLGLDLRWRATENLAIVADVFAGAYPIQEAFLRRSDLSIVLETPYIDWGILIGIVFLK
ncbi:MAG: autotransporter domain-containing protein [Deltaproteobacteria bacterium]|nr:autotransporter domain-containing protein [Deltaproteobacteria bacterium]